MKSKVLAATEVHEIERRRAWRQTSIERLKAKRAIRARHLHDEGEAVRRALDSYKALDDPNVVVRLRTPFVALAAPRTLPPSLGGPDPEEPLPTAERRREDWRTRPPLTKLIMGRSHALPTYLSMLYLAHAEAGVAEPSGPNLRSNTSRVDRRDSWAVTCGRWASTARARRARMARDLDELARSDLVEIRGRRQQGRYEGFGLLSELVNTEPYRPPDNDLDFPNVVQLPSTFFTRGWHLTLTPAETATLLVARHANLAISKTAEQPGVGIPQSTRWATYGLSGEAYGSIHELEEFGLLTVVDPMPQRRHGKFQLLPADVRAEHDAEGESFTPVPYRLQPVDDTAFDRPALQTVHACLFDNPTPRRLRD